MKDLKIKNSRFKNLYKQLDNNCKIKARNIFYQTKVDTCFFTKKDESKVIRSLTDKIGILRHSTTSKLSQKTKPNYFF